MPDVSILDHDAVGDGSHNDGPAVQAAIEACARAGGGRVVVPGGRTYLIGSIELRSGFELHLERGAVLDGSGDPADYTSRLTTSALSGGVIADHSEDALILIGAVDAHDVAITGPGEVRGGGLHFVTGDTGYIYRAPNQRPYTVFFRGCRDVTLRETRFTDAGLWCIRLTGVERALVHGITIDADLKFPNADGIDLDRCRQVRISDCDISCGDDAISLKTSEEFAQYGETRDVVVTNCVLRSTSSAVVVGVDAVDDIRDVVVSSCVIRGSHRGLSVNLGQRGDFSNILFSDCIVETRRFADDWWGHGEPIYVSAYPWHDEVGVISNVRFRHILARSENGAYIAAQSPELIRGVVLQDVRIELSRWSSWPGGTYDRRPFSSGEEIYPSRIAGIHVDRATDVTLRDCEVVFADAAAGGAVPAEYGHALEAIDVDGLTVQGLRGTSADPDLEATRVWHRSGHGAPATT